MGASSFDRTEEERNMSLLVAMLEGKERNNWVALEKFLEEMGTERTQQMRV